ncbi:hypothetical protein B0O80DRAFT_472900 [Mortierella sp. GBAus27b]|nr:hypothetical protein B0O80DRAFT_472900 [Mortierella sp. GBAus27b]
MAITNPLDLPEIRETLAPHLPSNVLARCIRVCKAWHVSFYPFLWASVDIHAKKNKQPPSKVLKKHRTLVRRLVYNGHIPRGHLSIHYPALRTLHVNITSDNDVTFKTIVKNHPSLSYLELRQQVATWYPNWLFPDTLSNLSTLRLIGVTVCWTNEKVFWRVCSLLETLDLRAMAVNPITLPIGIPRVGIFLSPCF